MPLPPATPNTVPLMPVTSQPSSQGAFQPVSQQFYQPPNPGSFQPQSFNNLDKSEQALPPPPRTKYPSPAAPGWNDPPVLTKPTSRSMVSVD